jgi:hypothetical protein
VCTFLFMGIECSKDPKCSSLVGDDGGERGASVCCWVYSG